MLGARLSRAGIAKPRDGTIWVSVPTLRVIRAYDRRGKMLKEIKGGDDLKLPFDRPMGVAYDKRSNELVVVDLENRVVRVPAAK